MNDKVIFDKTILEIKIGFLNKQYVFLSQLEDEFPRTSKHKACAKIDKFLGETLKDIDVAKKELDLINKQLFNV